MNKTILYLSFLASIIFTSFININGKSDFENQLENVIKEAVEKYEPNNDGFVIDIKKENHYYIQILHNSDFIRPENYNGKFEFSVTIYFDQQKEKEVALNKKFNQLKLSKEFTFFDCDSCNGYAKNVKKDYREAIKTTLILIKKLYGTKDFQDVSINLISFKEIEAR